MTVIRPLLLAFALAGSACLTAQAQSPFSSPDAPVRTVTVTGHGEASARPDLAYADFTVLRAGKTAREALDAANTGMTAVLEGMKAEGIEDRDLRTAGFSINPQYRYDQNQDGTQKPPELVGYEVRNSLTVRVRAVDKIGAILDKAVSLGANEGGSIRFDFTDPEGLRGAARRSAVADARAAAEILAEAAGVKLGRVLDITTNVEQEPLPPVPMLRMAQSAAAPEVPVALGENTIDARVRIIFEIAP